MLTPTAPRKFLLFALLAAGFLIVLAILFYQSLSAKQAAPEVSYVNLKGEKISSESLRGKVVMVNFWATWCTPCVEEMPLLNAFYQRNKPKSWQVLGLAIDQPSAVKRFLSQYPVEYPIGLAGLNGTALMTALGNLQGGLPFTLVIDAQQGLRMKKLGKLTEADIGSWA